MKEAQIKEAYTKLMSKYAISSEYKLFRYGVLFGYKQKRKDEKL